MDQTPNAPRASTVGIAAAALAIAVAARSASPLVDPLTAPRVADAALAVPAAQGAARPRRRPSSWPGDSAWPGTPGAPARSADQVTGALVDTVDFRLADGRLAAEIVRGRRRPPRAHRRPHRPAEWSRRAPSMQPARRPRPRRLVPPAGWRPRPSTPVTTWDAGMDAWCVRWVRTIDGVPAPTDGLVTWVRPSGRLKALSDASSPLADAPARPIPAAAAEPRGPGVRPRAPPRRPAQPRLRRPSPGMGPAERLRRPDHGDRPVDPAARLGGHLQLHPARLDRAPHRRDRCRRRHGRPHRRHRDRLMPRARAS